MGILLGFVVGGYIPYMKIPYIFVLPVIYILLVAFYVPETPAFLVKKNREEEAYKSLKFYRSTKEDSQSLRDEFEGIKDLQKLLQNEEKVSWKAYCKFSLEHFSFSLYFKFNYFPVTKEARFALAMSIFLSILFECSGAFPLIQFTAPVLKQAGSSLDPNDAAIIVAVVQILGNVASMPLIDRIGRKVHIHTEAIMMMMMTNKYVFAFM